MSLWLKSVLSVFMLAQVVVGLYCMLEILGRDSSQPGRPALRRIHVVNGYLFLALSLILSYYCLPVIKFVPGGISDRALIHSLLAVGMLAALTLKILFIRRYRKFMGRVQDFGLTVFFLSLGVIATSGGYYLMAEVVPPQGNPVSGQNDIEAGRKLFDKWCVGCHTDGDGFGPDLTGLFKKGKLPVSGQLVTPENIRRQLLTPARVMPPQKQLTDEEIRQLIEYLKTI